ncbi:uncharacterized protein SCODWIG_00186 [Saccharomycodes ludwigii]|uniref:Ubiquitin-like protease family profile domain-containing protein n=1 Tax=Saccharomycodes ludwigii TaxID=36035 RepID=A0A376B163_9ASCO|nr:hypothetical protein SCDLUD_000701 [Saccharomycodes ludwigii]KAH3903090.1 hypothetical protein SCDLUD_000701 [Saccharomycodes ludwigii]SSD58425.1 uncharacterized protein SCODWIG_00186 [Saccharomycodes ludwigii]
MTSPNINDNGRINTERINTLPIKKIYDDQSQNWKVQQQNIIDIYHNDDIADEVSDSTTKKSGDTKITHQKQIISNTRPYLPKDPAFIIYTSPITYLSNKKGVADNSEDKVNDDLNSFDNYKKQKKKEKNNTLPYPKSNVFHPKTSAKRKHEIWYVATKDDNTNLEKTTIEHLTTSESPTMFKKIANKFYNLLYYKEPPKTITTGKTTDSLKDTVEYNKPSIKRTERNGFDTQFVPRKRTKPITAMERRKIELSEKLTGNLNANNLELLDQRKDPFNWNSLPDTDTMEKDDRKKNLSPYGTAFFRKRKHIQENEQLALCTKHENYNGQNELAFLKKIYNGESYRTPASIEKERENQLNLLKKDSKKQNSYTFKNTVQDLVDRIKKSLFADSKDIDGNNNDVIFVKEQAVDPTTFTRPLALKEKLIFDRSLVTFHDEFKAYKAIIEEREQLKQELEKRRKEKLSKSLIPDLSQHELDKVYSIFENGTSTKTWRCYDLDIGMRDIKTLVPGRWLNDTIIEFFMKYIENKNEKVVSFNSFFFTALSERGYQGVRRWMKRKKVDINNLSKIFTPININRSHWALGMIDITRKKIIYVDSLSNASNTGPKVFSMLSLLKDYLLEESKGKLGDGFELEHIGCPQQPNGFDCGIYVCMNSLYLSKNRYLDFKSKDALKMREYIADLIINSD